MVIGMVVVMDVIVMTTGGMVMAVGVVVTGLFESKRIEQHVVGIVTATCSICICNNNSRGREGRKGKQRWQRDKNNGSGKITVAVAVWMDGWIDERGIADAKVSC